MCLSCLILCRSCFQDSFEKQGNVSIIKAFKRQIEGGILCVTLCLLAQTYKWQDLTQVLGSVRSNNLCFLPKTTLVFIYTTSESEVLARAGPFFSGGLSERALRCEQLSNNNEEGNLRCLICQ